MIVFVHSSLPQVLSASDSSMIIASVDLSLFLVPQTSPLHNDPAVN